ncbi:MAG: hypothetical protein H6709_09110 [Kofleriaceae bacterium]|nr:hypothetical protein [Kofleriaceae bacterium]MCB9572229.1 hypothetical protein [Kofleriaceae bacterium]
MWRRLLHAVAVAAVLAAVAVALQSTTRLPLPAAAGGVWLLWYALGSILMPRLAHAAFRAGDTGKARRRYRVLGVLSPGARDAARVSVAGSWLLDRDWPRARRALAAIDGDALAAPLRAAWLNNRAYGLARGGAAAEAGVDDGAGPDGGAAAAAAAAGREALALIDEALATRPEVPAFLHTRGLALLAAGRLDEAIRAFEAVWDTGELDPGLEAERCHDLAVAWERKGHADYAADYRRRAAQAMPTSPWAQAVRVADPATVGQLEELIAG